MTETERVLIVTRVLEATPERVWEAWSDPDQLHKFFAPAGSSVPRETVTMDFREGGEFSLKMHNDSNDDIYPMDATYKTIVPPEKLVFQTSGGIEGTIELEDVGMGKTLLTWTTRASMSDELYGGAVIGSHSAADQLVEFFAEARV